MKNSNYFFIILTLIIAFALSNGTLFCQTADSTRTAKDSIKIKRSDNEIFYFLGEKKFSKKGMVSFLKKDLNTKDMMGTYNTKQNWGYVFGCAGAVMTAAVFYEISSSINNTYVSSPLSSGAYNGSHNPSNIILLSTLALGFDAVAVFFFMSSNSQFKGAIKTYNKNSFASLERVKLNIGANRIGFTFQLN